MRMIKCQNCGGYYDKTNKKCPYCNLGNDEKTEAVKIWNSNNEEKTEVWTSSEIEKTELFHDQVEEKEPPKNYETPTPRPTSSEETIFVYKDKKIKSSNNDLLVGWLVIIDGEGKGKDFRIIPGQNSIGRDETNTICIDNGDNAISREKHAFVIYDMKHNKFVFKNGDGQNLSYLNDEGVYAPMEIKEGDIIEIGNTKLKFIPFCRENCEWW